MRRGGVRRIITRIYSTKFGELGGRVGLLWSLRYSLSSIDIWEMTEHYLLVWRLEMGFWGLSIVRIVLLLRFHWLVQNHLLLNLILLL